MIAYRRMAVMAVFATIVLISGYWLATLTEIGQSLDDQAKIARSLEDQSIVRIVVRSLGLINAVTFPMMIFVLVAVGWVRDRVFLGVAAGTAFAASVVTADILKATLPRPELASGYASVIFHGRDFDTYPSGHSAAATGFVLGLVLVSSPRSRLPVGVVGALAATGVTGGVIVAGWHRPSDAIGGIALASLFSTIAALVVLKRQGESVPGLRAGGAFAWFTVGALVASAVFLMSVLLAPSLSNPGQVKLWLFPVSVLAIIWFTAAMIGWFTTILLGVRFRRV